MQIAAAIYSRFILEISERIGELSPIRQRQLRIQLQERYEDEAAGGYLAMGQGEAVSAQFQVAEEQEVDVEGPGAVAGGFEAAAAGGLYSLAGVEEGFGLQVGADADGGVEEIGLIEDLADGLDSIPVSCESANEPATRTPAPA